MTKIKNLNQIKSFVELLNDNHIESTGAYVVNFVNDLYNVDGSGDDPKRIPGHNGENWKPLLQSYGINNNCYVTNPNAEGSHPDFSVGGHMTPNANGQVDHGGVCYLMPLCWWHNSKSRDGVRFTHDQTQMLQLTGYQLGEMRVTFELRLPNEQPYAVLFYHENEWKFKNITQLQSENLEEKVFNEISPNQTIYHYVLISRNRDEKTIHKVTISKLP